MVVCTGLRMNHFHTKLRYIVGITPKVMSGEKWTGISPPGPIPHPTTTTFVVVLTAVCQKSVPIDGATNARYGINCSGPRHWKVVCANGEQGLVRDSS